MSPFRPDRGREITVAIVGAGERGANAYGPRLHRRGVARVVAVAEPDPRRRAAAAATFGLDGAACFTGWDELFAPGTGRLADVALVATGDAQHVEPTVLALDAGYHVLLEKPMALDDEGCGRIVAAADRTDRLVGVCHVYRYASLFARLHELVAAGDLGEVVSIELSENVAYWHFVHSYVRGLTRNSRVPMLLQKSCHDLDLLTWLAGAPASEVVSMVRPTRFTEDQAPPGAPEHCIEGCPHAASCPYDAEALYVRLEPMLRDLALHRRPPGIGWLAPAVGRLRTRALRSSNSTVRGAVAWRRWPVTAVSDDLSVEGIEAALRTTRWGRCAWKVGDNDQPSAQTVDIRFANGVLGSFTMQSASHRSMRQVRVDGTRASAVGELAGLESWLEVTDHRSGRRTRRSFPLGFDGHGGGEGPLVDAFLAAVRGEVPLEVSARDAWESHRIAFAAMQSAATSSVVALPRPTSATDPGTAV